jgi:hypothetical protein
MNGGRKLTRKLAIVTVLAFACATAPVLQATDVWRSVPSEFFIPSSGDHELDLVIARVGRDLGVDPRLIHAVIWQESKYKNEAVSHVGAQGLMQLMPATAKRLDIYGDYGHSSMLLTNLSNGYSKLALSECVKYDNPQEGHGAGRIEVVTVSRVGGHDVDDKRIYYAPALNPGRVRKYRQTSSPAAEMLPVGAEFTFWAGEGDDPTPISDKVTVIVQPKNNLPVMLQIKDSVASAQ